MMKLRVFITLIAGLIALEGISVSAQRTADAARKRAKPRSTDTYVLSAAWETIAFWEKEVSRHRLHYLAGTAPPSISISPVTPDWGGPANIAPFEVKSLPSHNDVSASGSPSYSSFLSLLKAAEEMKRQEDERRAESEGHPGDDNSSDSVEVQPVVDPVTPLQDEVFADDLSATELRHEMSEDIETVFPRPYEQFVSGERLLLFFPLARSSSENVQNPGIMLPVDSDLIFQPPSVNIPRSSASIRREP